MKKSAFPAALLLLMLASSGCPVYDRDDGCFDDFDCRDGYACNADTGNCIALTDTNSCNEPTDCVGNETCSRSGTCMVGDCHFASVGCVRGYECSPGSGKDRVWHCVAAGASEGGASSGGSDASGVGGALAGDAGANDGGGAPAAAGGGG